VTQRCGKRVDRSSKDEKTKSQRHGSHASEVEVTNMTGHGLDGATPFVLPSATEGLG
jgi:hypothetical protein